MIFIRRSLAEHRDKFGCNVLPCASHCDDLCLRRRNFALRALPTGLPMPLSLSVEIKDENCGVVLICAGAGPKRRNTHGAQHTYKRSFLGYLIFFAVAMLFNDNILGGKLNSSYASRQNVTHSKVRICGVGVDVDVDISVSVSDGGSGSLSC
ncbi:hypothetical protein GQX74_002771 [Glossina fuscipes]|nr:hypothetical protein GQX74_002771 [Glossina fuscipes]